MSWSLDDVDWEKLEPQRVDRSLLEAVKAASLVEANSADYVQYLHNVFADDDEFKAAASLWGVEERQHGDALGRWAELVDPSFDYAACLQRFRDGYQIPLEAAESVRGSRSGELVARCVVESGTCSFYSAIRDRAEDPVLKQIAGFIARDEAQHYRLFKTHLDRYLENRKMNMWARCKIAFGRVAEADDDELAFAYYSANIGSRADAKPYVRSECARENSRRTLGLYEYKHVRSAAHMILSATDMNPANRIAKAAIWIAWQLLQLRNRFDRGLAS